MKKNIGILLFFCSLFFSCTYYDGKIVTSTEAVPQIDPNKSVFIYCRDTLIVLHGFKIFSDTLYGRVDSLYDGAEKPDKYVHGENIEDQTHVVLNDSICKCEFYHSDSVKISLTQIHWIMSYTPNKARTIGGIVLWGVALLGLVTADIVGAILSYDQQ
jgi:hypothetical protein